MKYRELLLRDSNPSANKLFQATGLFLSVLLLLPIFLSSSSTAFGQADNAQAAVRDFNATAALQNSGLHERAAERWAEFLKKYPTDERIDRVTYYLGVSQLHAKKYPESAASFRTVLAKFPQFKSRDGAQFNLGMALYNDATAKKDVNGFTAAAAEFGKVSAQYKTSKLVTRSLYYEGECLYTTGKKAEAAVAYQKLVTEHATSSLFADAIYALGTTYQELNKEKEAAETFQKFIGDAKLAAHPYAGEIRLRLGISQANLKDYPAADKSFAEAAATDKFPLADYALLRQAQARIDSGKEKEAAPLVTQLIQKFPNSQYRPAAMLLNGRCQFLAGNFAEAKKSLQTLSTENRPEAAEASYWLGRTHLKEKNSTEALKVLDRAVGTFKEGEFVPYILVARADALYEIEARRAEAAKIYEEFIAKYKDHALAPQALYMVALSSLGQKDFPKAKTISEQFLADAKLKEHELRASVLFVAGESYLLGSGDQANPADAAKAEQFYRQLLQAAPTHVRAPRAKLRIGWCLYQSDKFAEAANHLNGAANELQEPDQKAEAFLLLGRSHMGQAKAKEAADAFSKSQQSSATWARGDEVLLAAAEAYRELDDANNAKTRLETLLAKFANSQYLPHATYQLAEIAHQQQQQDTAVKYFDEVIKKFPQSEFLNAARYGLAAAHFAKEEYDKAKPILDALLAASPKADDLNRGHYLRGLVQHRMEKYTEAVADLQKYIAVTDKTKSVDAQYTLALCQIKSDKFVEAEKSLAALATTDKAYPHLDKAYYELGHTCLAKSDQPRATAAFELLLQQAPTSELAPEAWFQVARSHEASIAEADAANVVTDKLTKSAAAYRKGSELAKDKSLQEKLLYKLGDVLFRQEKFADAATVLAQQIQAHADGELIGPARFLAAESYYRQDDFAKALPLYEQVAQLKVEKYHAQSLYRAGDCAAKQQNWPSSETHFDTLLKGFADFELRADAKYGLALAKQKQNKLDEAIQYFEQVTVESNAEIAAKARFMIGEITFGKQEYAKAVEHFLLVAVGYPYKEWQALAHYETGRCLVEIGEKEKAIAALEKVVKNYADHPKAQDAAKLVAELKK
jgi:TolA-binding protein